MFGIEGKIWKSCEEENWVISFPSLDSMTEGDSKEEALAMGEDLILSYFEDEIDEGFKVRIVEGQNGQITAFGSDSRLLLSFFRAKQEELSSMHYFRK